MYMIIAMLPSLFVLVKAKQSVGHCTFSVKLSDFTV